LIKPNVFVKNNIFSADLVEFSENRANTLREKGVKFYRNPIVKVAELLTKKKEK
jgi:hypothetical protein